MTSQIYVRDLPRIRDVVERVGIKDNEVSALAGSDGSQVSLPENLSRRPRGRHQHLGRRNARHHHVLALGVHRPANELIALLTATVGADTDLDAGRAQLRDAASQPIPRVLPWFTLPGGGQLERPLEPPD